MDCLIMSLPAEVSDNTLRKLGEMKMEILSTSTYGKVDLAFKALADRGNARIVAGEGTYFTDSAHSANNGQEVLELGSNYIVNGEGGSLFLGNKQNITNMTLDSGVKMNLDEIKYCNELVWLYGKSGTLEGDIANFAGITDKLNHFDVRSVNNVYGDLSVFENTSELTLLLLERTKCSGSILNLKDCHNLATLYLYDTTGVTGDPDDLADAMYDEGNGRTSGTLTYTSPSNVRSVYTFTASGWTKA